MASVDDYVHYENFNKEIKDFKEKYMTNVSQFLSQYNKDRLELVTQNDVQEAISQIKGANRLSELGKLFERLPIEERYELADDGGVDILVIANTSIQVLPYEKCFDVFLEVHRETKHAGIDKMYPILEEYYSFPEVCLVLFLQCCDVCLKYTTWKSRKVNKNTRIPSHLCVMFNVFAYVDVLDISRICELKSDFRYVLVYKEKSTGYVLLRPLTGFGCRVDNPEVAMELYRIFIDFGTPQIIKTTAEPLMKHVKAMLENTPVKCTFTISSTNVVSSPLRQKIFTRMKNWLSRTKHANWAIGVYVVQSELNLEGNPKPMEKLFKKKVATAKPTCERDKFPTKTGDMCSSYEKFLKERDPKKNISIIPFFFDECNYSDEAAAFYREGRLGISVNDLKDEYDLTQHDIPCDSEGEVIAKDPVKFVLAEAASVGTEKDLSLSNNDVNDEYGLTQNSIPCVSKDDVIEVDPSEFASAEAEPLHTEKDLSISVNDIKDEYDLTQDDIPYNGEVDVIEADATEVAFGEATQLHTEEDLGISVNDIKDEYDLTQDDIPCDDEDEFMEEDPIKLIFAGASNSTNVEENVDIVDLMESD